MGKILATIMGTALIIVFVLSFVIPWFAGLSAESEYNKTFGAHVIMAHDQATFEGMKKQVLILWTNMNATFAGYDLDNTYSTWWGPSQTYESSLGAQRDYFRELIKSIDNYIFLYQNKVLNASDPTLLEDWYYKSMNSLRDEMTREGDLDWNIYGAFYLYKHPLLYYWDHIFGVISFAVLVSLLIVSWGYVASKSDD